MLINRGIKLDNHQLEIIKTTESENTKEILKGYEKPYWQKIFNYTGPNINGNEKINLRGNNSSEDNSSEDILSGDNQSDENEKLNEKGINNFIENSEVPFELRLLAYSLGLNYNAGIKTLINQIKQIGLSDPVAYKTAFIRRQMSRISNNASTPLDFVNEPNLEKYTARNISLLTNKKKENPYEYNELDLGVYKDNNEVVWIFTSDMFEHVILTKKNPYTNDILPDEFISNLRMQRSLIKRLGFNINGTMTVSVGLEKYQKKDTINNDESNRLVNQFEQISKINGVNIDSLKKISYESKTEIFKLNKILINNLNDFTPEHQYVIFCRACLLYLQNISNDPDFSIKNRNFFRSLNTELMAKTS